MFYPTVPLSATRDNDTSNRTESLASVLAPLPGAIVHQHPFGRLDDLPAGLHLHPMPAGVAEFARQLYASLRRLDDGDFDTIVVEQPPDDEAWRAVNDRLGRASTN